MTQENKNFKNLSNYHDLNYFDSNHEELNDSKDIIDANYTSFEVTCRRCQSSFSSNNLLHSRVTV